MVRKKLDSEKLEVFLSLFDSGETPTNLALKFGMSASTVSRYLKKHHRCTEYRTSHHVLINDIVKSKLKRILSERNIADVDLLISDLDREFLIEVRNVEEVFIINVQEE